MSADIAMQGIVLSLASGRVAYSLVHDEIMRPIREWVWLHSAPEGGTIRTFGDDGFEYQELPAAMFHRVTGPQANIGDTSHEHRYLPMETPRKPQFFGQLFECPYCMTFWTSLLAAIAWAALGDYAVIAAAPLALWALANIIAVKAL